MPSSVSKDPRRVRRMFDRVAGQYDFLNRLLSLGLDELWRKHLVETLDQPPVLDLACGSGDVLRRLGDSGLGTGATGVDFSRRMLREARDKLEASESSEPLVQGDALKLPLQDEVYGGVTCAFGVRNFQERLQAFTEVYRVLCPGGKFAVLEFFPPGESLLGKPIRWYLGSFLPTVGNFVSDSNDAYDYLRRSINNFVSARTLTQELREAGFEDISVTNEFFGLVKLVSARKDGSPDA